MESLVCPITLCNIVEIGITCVGSMYEYSAIVNWLKDHSTDPLTNLMLPSKYVIKTTYQPNLKSICDNLLQSTKLWARGFLMFVDAPERYNDLLELIPNTQNDEWDLYCKNFNIMNHESIYFKQTLDNRPPNTGMSLQFMSLPNISIQNQCFKSDLLDFSHLKNCHFINCDFSRCRFFGTIFENVYFRNCRFIGEEICFYKATSPGYLVFDKCAFEYVDRWKETKNITKIKLILKSRLLECQYQVK